MLRKFTFSIGLIGLLTTSQIMAAQVSPTPVAQVDHSGTVDGSAHVVLTANTCGGSGGCRYDCFLQNKGSNVMYYSFTGVATNGSKQLPPGAVMNCNNGVAVDQTGLSLLGTAADTYSLTESFMTGQ